MAPFFGGLAIGVFVLDGPVSRSRVPGRWYVGLEVVIGLWALATIVLIPALNRLAAEGIGLDPSPVRLQAVLDACTTEAAAIIPNDAAFAARVDAYRAAQDLRATDRREAIRLLEGLAEAVPGDPRAGGALRELRGGS